MVWYAVYSCGCIKEVEEKNPVNPKWCPKHYTRLRVAHESEEWAKKTPEYQERLSRL